MNMRPIIAAGADTAPDAPRRLKLLTIGGCNTLEIGRRLAFAYDHQHFWNVTWPSLASDPFPPIALPPDRFFDVWRPFIQRECDKTAAQQIASGAFDVVLLSDGLQVLNDFVVLGGACIPDFTTERYLTAADLDGAPRPAIRDLVGPEPRLVSWRDPDFGAFISASFERLHDRVLRPAMALGTRFILHNHLLAPAVLTAEGEAAAAEPDFAEMTGLIAAIFARAAAFPGIAALRPSPVLNFTSAAAPYGASMSHPIEEQYVHLAAQLSDLLGDGLATTVYERHLIAAHKAGLARQAAHEAELHKAAAEVQRVSRVLEEQARQADAAERACDKMARSVSWRVTAPLRALRGLGRFWRPIPKPP